MTPENTYSEIADSVAEAAIDPAENVPHGKHRKKKRRKKHRVLKWILIIILLLVAAGAGYVAYVCITAQDIDTNNIYDLLNTTSMMYDGDGKELEAVGTADSRTLVKYKELPDNLKNAFIAIEDKTFYKHHGFNIVRMFGAIGNSITSGGRVGGTSTITQQLARNLYLSNERTIERKIKEAYYTVILENELSKNQILEAYLNTIYLGYNSSGVKSAAKAYFGVDDLNDLTVAECSVLASIPKSPSHNAPIKKVNVDDINADDPNVLSKSSDGTYVSVYNDGYRTRQKAVLRNMKEQGYITDAQYKEALNEDIKSDLKPTEPVKSTVSTYFSDYCLDEVKKDLMSQYNMDESAALNMIHNRGLKIYTTIDVDMQEKAEKQFERSGNFPGVTNLRRDSSRNIMGKGRGRNNILLYYKDNYFENDGSFVLSSDEYKMDGSGSLVILKGHKLNIYKTSDGKPELGFKNMYEMQGGRLYTIKGGYFKGLGSQYLSFDSDGNAVVSKEFLKASPDYFQMGDDSVTIAKDNCELAQSSVQPQGAMVITDYKTGQIKVMVGGRGEMTGKKLYNRSIQPRQPGSSIKPIAVYGPALEAGVDKNTSRYNTAGSTVEDSPTSNGWPTNWYNGYRGYVTLRTAMEQSMNVPAVKIVNYIGYDWSAEMLKKNGVTTVVETGDSTDLNPAALGLGGMLKGISPLQMASAYGTFANGGVHIDPTSYTKVEDSQGNAILQKEPAQSQAYNKGVAWIMTNMLQSVVTKGIAGRAAIGVQPVGGKTGTTTDNFDAWFVGVTPQYAAALWIGNDVNIELSQGSNAAATLWARIMRQELAGTKYASFGSRPDDVYSSGGEYFVKGTRRRGASAVWKSGDGDKKKESESEDKKKKKTTSTTTTRTQQTETSQTTTDNENTENNTGQDNENTGNNTNTGGNTGTSTGTNTGGNGTGTNTGGNTGTNTGGNGSYPHTGGHSSHGGNQSGVIDDNQ